YDKPDPVPQRQDVYSSADVDVPSQHLESIKKTIDERVQLKREHDSWVNERKMTKTTEENVDTSKASDASLVDTESSRKESKEQDTSSRSGNDAHDDDVDIRPYTMKSQWLRYKRLLKSMYLL
nr:hypothetical protein [Tanacetum cinerariifolium]